MYWYGKNSVGREMVLWKKKIPVQVYLVCPVDYVHLDLL